MKDIFNADETGLYYSALPSCSMVVKSDPHRGLKIAKERITALIAASAIGEKLKPLVCGYGIILASCNIQRKQTCVDDIHIVEGVAGMPKFTEEKPEMQNLIVLIVHYW